MASVFERIPGRVAAVVVILILAVSVGVFLIDPGTTPEPVAFEDTVKMGMSDADLREAEFEGYEIPRAQVFYSQYGYVVGYNGVDTFARNVQESRYERVWGVPTKAYVSDFSGTEPSSVGDGFVETDGTPGWIDAEDAVYAVTQDAVVPFSSSEDAEAYAEENGGETRDFEGLLETEFEAPNVLEVAEERLEERADEADAKVEEARELLNRDVSVTVGENETVETVQEAVEAAPSDTAVRIPSDTYNEDIVVDKPLTLVGEDGVRLVGDGNGTVVSVEADDTAVVSVSISGIGNETRGQPGSVSGWDAGVEEAYGHTDSGIVFNTTSRGFVHDVEIDTPSTGILFFDTEGGVVSQTTVNGTDEWVEGFMGVLTIRSPAVVQNSSFYAGRDSVYSHASDGLVVRDNYMQYGRFGVHLMYTSETLIRGNTVRDKELSVIIIMTSPTGNYIVGNDVRGSQNGVSTVGTASYFADNVVVGNENGIRMGARSSVYTRNVVAHNSIGARASSIIPSNRVTENDFVENDLQVTTAEGAMRIWGQDGVGNYWSNAPPGAEEFRPTDPIDSSTTTVDGMVTIHESPAYSLLHRLETVVPGMLSTGIVDESPLSEPAVYDAEAHEGQTVLASAAERRKNDGVSNNE